MRFLHETESSRYLCSLPMIISANFYEKILEMMLMFIGQKEN